MTAKEAVDEIIVAADHRVTKFIFPFNPWLAVQLKNALPKYINNVVKRKAKM